MLESFTIEKILFIMAALSSENVVCVHTIFFIIIYSCVDKVSLQS